jgi:hypothetical protein
MAGAWQGFKAGYFDAAVEQGETFTGLGKGAWGAAEGAVTGLVGLGVTATKLQMGAVQGTAQFAVTGDPSKLHEVASEAFAIGSAVKNEIATTVKVAAEAYKNPSLALDAATELGIEGTAEVLGGATFETAVLVASAPKGASVVAAGRKSARLTSATARVAERSAVGERVAASLQQSRAVRAAAGGGFGRYAANPRVIAAEAGRGARSAAFSRGSRLKGTLGEALSVAERALHGERVIGRQITVTAGGARMRADLVTRNVFSGKVKVVESKFGRTARLERGQPTVARAITQTGDATVRGRKSIRTLRSHGIQGGSYRRGMPMRDLDFIEQRFPLLERVVDMLPF